MLRASESDLHWQVRDGTHPKMGPIQVAISTDAHTSYIGTARIVSTAYLSCEKKTGKIALEFTNARNTELSSGLKLKESPRLTCLGIAGPGALPARSEIAATWEANELGDVLTRGLSPTALRSCIAIEVQEKIVLPPAIGREIEEVTFEIPTFAPAPDTIFTTCGEATAYVEDKPAAPEKPALVTALTPKPVTPAAPPPPATVAPTPKAAPAPPPTPTSPAPAVDPTWKRAHTVAKGHSNIRKSPNLTSPVVAQLPPGVRILVQQTSNEWWHVKSPSGATFDGYIRDDRFTLDP